MTHLLVDVVVCATGSETTLEELEALLTEGRERKGGEASGEDKEAMQGWVLRYLPYGFRDGLALTPKRLFAPHNNATLQQAHGPPGPVQGDRRPLRRPPRPHRGRGRRRRRARLHGAAGRPGVSGRAGRVGGGDAGRGCGGASGGGSRPRPPHSPLLVAPVFCWVRAGLLPPHDEDAASSFSLLLLLDHADPTHAPPTQKHRSVPPSPLLTTAQQLAALHVLHNGFCVAPAQLSARAYPVVVVPAFGAWVESLHANHHVIPPPALDLTYY